MNEPTSDIIHVLKKELITLRERIKRLDAQLAASNAAFLNVVGKSLEAILVIDSDKRVLFSNHAAIQLFGRNLADLLGEPLDIPLNLAAVAANNAPIAEVIITQPHGERIITDASVISIEWNDALSYLVSFRDITERKKTEEVLEYMAQHDYLTDLPNRIIFEKQMSVAMSEAKSYHSYMALLYLDLDDFKKINDTLGHDVGDLLLKKVSHVLQKNTREGDTVARLGGDEFVLILRHLRKLEYAATVARNMLKKLSHPFYLDGSVVYVNASIGIACYPQDSTTAVDLIKNADAAMYKAKHKGKNQYCFFNERDVC
ncbi:MAG: hypothetical protein A3E83_00985 [Gammaproteobacteria bacterium RIFCSPHIGHO2_12_FULL_41_20]|nr:MAG: hypothetical protein A3E83_00985 [Gammaproteobacteria bacterium RIFCSPHIGHO2_12_FULL_41_20]